MIDLRLHVWSTPNSGLIVHVVIDAGLGVRQLRGDRQIRELLLRAAESDQP